LFTELVAKALKLVLNQTFSPMISLAVCVEVPFLRIESESRQLSVPPEPDSCGIVKTMRGSKAPFYNA
jgi:hypothetical protein